MSSKSYAQPVALGALAEDLAAAIPALVTTTPLGPRLRYTLETLTPGGVRITVPDSVPLSAVDAVLAAHDPTRQTASEQVAAADGASLAALRAQYQTLKDGLGTIRAHMATIQVAPNPTTANLAAVVGVANAVKQIAADVTTLTTGLDRLLDTLAVFVRRQS